MGAEVQGAPIVKELSVSTDLKAMIVRNELALPKESVDRLLSMNGRRQLSPLSLDSEAAPFLLYCCGDTLEVIAAKTNLPKDVIVATAIYYRWPEKAKLLSRDNVVSAPGDITNDLVKTILVATAISMQRDLGDVIAGRKDPKDCPLIPKSISSLQTLIEMVQAAGGAPAPAAPTPGVTNITATNVQINTNEPAKPENEQDKAVSRLAKLKELADSNE
jgi:hypothetical protein